MTINKLPAYVVDFAAGDTKLYENFADFWNHYRSEHGNKKFSYIHEVDGKTITLEEKEKALNAMLIKEISKKANFDITGVPLEQVATNPNICWAAANIVSTMIDAVLPQTMVEGTSAYAEIKVVGYGETGVFDIQSRDLFHVTKAGRGAGMREAEMQKAFRNQVTINPEGHEITVGVSLFRVLNGSESLAEFTVKAIRSLETEMTKDIYTAMDAVMKATSTDATTGLQVTGYTMADLLKLQAKVSAFSGGAKAIVMGTKVALSNIFPDDGNYRFDIESPFMKLGYVRTIGGVDTFEIPQIADWTNPFSTYISDSSLWVVAPGTDKLIKCVIGGSTLSNVSDTWGAATLLQNATFIKNWKAGFASSAIAGYISL
jgi:hypothetical protein